MKQNNSKLTGFIADLMRIFGDEIFDNVNGRCLKGKMLNYIAALKSKNNLNELKDYLNGKLGFNFTEISIPYFDALYIETQFDFTGFILCVNEAYITLDPGFLNYGMDQKISEAFIKAVIGLNLKSFENMDWDSFAGIADAFSLNASKRLKISFEEYKYVVFTNTQSEYVRIYNGYRLQPGKTAAFDWGSSGHVEYFGLWYYAMIKVMSDTFKSSPGASEFVIHDAGTSVVQFPLMLATLKQEELMGLKVKEVIASDLVLRSQDDMKRYKSQYADAKDINIIQCDFTDETKELPEADVTILNDVLEHFSTEEISFRVMERFWNRTKKLLIIHVPQEEVPNAMWGHFISFNRNKLLEWASRLSSHRLLADEYRFSETCTYMDAGFLILERI